MKPVFISHESYQSFILRLLQQHYPNGCITIRKKDWALILKLWLTDLSCISTLLNNSYSNKGPKPRNPSAMMRSYLIFLIKRPGLGITEWVEELHRVKLYAILSGFESGDIPGVGTFYDFFNRLYSSEKSNKKSKIKKKKKRKNKKKVKKHLLKTQVLLNDWLIDFLNMVLRKKNYQLIDYLIFFNLNFFLYLLI